MQKKFDKSGKWVAYGPGYGKNIAIYKGKLYSYSAGNSLPIDVAQLESLGYKPMAVLYPEVVKFIENHKADAAKKASEDPELEAEVSAFRAALLERKNSPSLQEDVIDDFIEDALDDLSDLDDFED